MIILIALLFFILMSVPILRAYIHYRRNDGRVLAIDPNRVQDPRYFGKSFAHLIEKNADMTSNDAITLSKKESFIDASASENGYESAIDDLIIAEHDFTGLKNVTEYKKEIYGAKNIILNTHESLLLRAAHSKGNMIIGSSTQVVRWIDAEGTLAIHDQCNLGISASSATRLSVGSKCYFRRLYAPEIRLGLYPEDKFEATEGKNPVIYNLPVKTDRANYVKALDDVEFNDEGIAPVTITSTRTVTIPENKIIQGDISSDGDVILKDGAVVCGNIFAEREIHLGKNTCVLGNVFSQGNIYMDDYAVVGQAGRIVSMIARKNIVSEKYNIVFGFISCEGQGISNGQPLPDESPRRASTFLAPPTYDKTLIFKDREDFNTLNNQDFRFFNHLEKVVMPKDVEVIPASMFYHCESLRDVVLSPALKDIGAYSFADCRSLTHLPLQTCQSLETIGVSAFENNEQLENITIPAHVHTIGAAAFSRCKNLKTVTFAPNSQLKIIDDHSFRGCESLETITLGEHVTQIGISAFKSCLALKKITLPTTCKNEPGIVSLSPAILDFYDVESADDRHEE